MVLAPAITMVSCSAVLRGYFAGLGSMKATSNSLIVEQFFNCVLSIGFVYACVGKDTAIMAAAGNLSTTCACAVALFYLVLFYSKRRVEIMGELNSQTVPEENKKSGELIKTILAISVPITLSSLITTANSTIDIFTVSNGIQSALAGTMDATALENYAMNLYGIMQKAEIVTHLPLAISGTLCSAIVPAIASHMAKKDSVGVNSKICSAAFVNSLIIFPCMVGMIVLAAPILKLLYPSAPEGQLMLVLLVTTLPFSSLTYVLNGILYGTGKQFIPAITIAIGSAIKLTLNIILVNIPSLNIYGAIIGTIVYQIFVFTVETFFVYRFVEIKLPFIKLFLKPAAASVLMGIAVYPTFALCSKLMGNTLSTIISIGVGMMVYGFAVLLLKTLREEDLATLPAGNKIGKILKKLHLV
jgi:stage V sporulation protein B